MKRIIFIIYTVVIAATILFGLAFKEQIVIGIESLIPIGAMAYMLFVGAINFNEKKGYYTYQHGRLKYYHKNVGLKYTKDSNGEGVFQKTNEDEAPDFTSRILAYSLFIGAALNIPFIVFFPFEIKLFTIVIFLISCAVSFVISLPHDIKESKKAIEEEKARQAEWKKELEEQKKREELGRWK